MVERIEPQLGNRRATLLAEYPRVEAALARQCSTDPRLAERFELFICGVELANGFGELTDPVEQRRRLEQEMAKKERLYGERYPIDEEFIAALGHMPPASGCAIGFDRLVMLAAGATRIDQVIVTPLREPGMRRFAESPSEADGRHLAHRKSVRRGFRPTAGAMRRAYCLRLAASGAIGQHQLAGGLDLVEPADRRVDAAPP